MSECVVEAKGNTASYLMHQKTAKMPGEKIEADCVVPEVSGSSGPKPLDIGKDVANELSDSPRNDDFPLYALANAAASRTSSPILAVKEEATTPSPSTSQPNRTSPTTKPKRSSLLAPEHLDTANLSTTPTTYQNKKATETSSDFNGRENGTDRLTAPHPAEIDSNSVGKHADQLHLMEAMMQRQRRVYEEYGHSNNWMKTQRSDNNCLGKSKAKRYRWCVQKEQGNEEVSVESSPTPAATLYANGNFVSPLKKKALMKRPADNNAMNDKLYGSVFTGASKLRCRDCGKSFSTLVDLTVHMSKAGHYRDQNIGEVNQVKASHQTSVKHNKRLMVETSEKESAEKVLKCLGCGYLFDSLQDLTVHMIKTKHYEDVPSLRLCSQKNDHCPSASEIAQPATDEKILSAAPRLASNMATDYSVRGAAEVLNYPSNGHDQANLDFFNPGGPMLPAFGNQQHSYSNMLGMAALRLLGFPPYFVQMPFPNAVGGYDVANAAYAAAAARLFLSSPWLTQMPGIGAGSMFPPFLNPPTTTLPPAMLPHSRQQYSAPGDFPLHSSLANQPIPSISRSRNGNRHPDSDVHHNVKSHILRCVQCGESFTSLQKMTDHMRETTHFPIAMTPPADETNHRRASVYSSGGESNFRGSPHPKHSPQQRPNAASAPSPLEQLAKLANGKSLDEGRHVPNPQYEHATESVRKPGSPTSKSPPVKQRPPSNNSYSSVGYICPSSPEGASNSPLSGFDFIKSLETTIQSAISRVNQPPCTSAREKRVQSLRGEYSRHRQPKKHRILDSFFPTASTRDCRKSLPTTCDKDTSSALCSEKSEALHRSTSDDEECYRNGKPSATDIATERASSWKQCSSSSALDLPKSINHSPGEIQILSAVDGTECKKVTATGDLDTCRRSPAQDKAQSVCKSAAFEPRAKNLQQGGEKNSGQRKKNYEGVAKFMPAEKRPREVDDSGVACVPPRKARKCQKVESRDCSDQRAEPDPLSEMQKIVNATELTMREGRNTLLSPKTVQKRKIEVVSATQTSEVRTSKASSVLSDLVRHDDDDAVSTVNPLAQMENLINLKIGRNAPVDKNSAARSTGKQNSARQKFSPLRDHTDQNCPDPMSALLNFFAGSNKNPSVTTAHVRKHDQSKISGSREKRSGNTNGLEVKMAEFLRSVIAQTQPLLDKKTHCSSEQSGLSPIKRKEGKADATLNLSQQIRLQAFFASRFEKNLKLFSVSNSEIESLSKEAGLSTTTIKKWISSKENLLQEHGRCDFLFLTSEPESFASFRCVWCAAQSASGLSARDFLHHLSTHIDLSLDCPKPETAEPESTQRKKDVETLFRGAVHFKSLKADDTSPEFSLTAHVTEKVPRPVYSASQSADAAERRNGVDVMEDGPIKVSG